MVSGHVRGDRPSDPAASLKRSVLRFEATPETAAMYRQVQKILGYAPRPRQVLRPRLPLRSKPRRPSPHPPCPRGTHQLSNLAVQREGHHLAVHEGSLVITGTPPNLTFTRRPNHALKIAERVADVTSALRTLGFRPHEVKTAVDQARAHVGTEDLTLEQWMKLALSKCPKPRS